MSVNRDKIIKDLQDRQLDVVFLNGGQLFHGSFVDLYFEYGIYRYQLCDFCFTNGYDFEVIWYKENENV